VRDLLDARLTDIEQQLAQLTALRDTIAELRDQAAQPEPESCSADQVCRYL
jgi:type II secretory pathway component PulM